MRKFWIIVCALLASCLMLIGCGGSSKSNDPELAAPTSIKMSAKGVLSWDKVEGATAYELVIGEQTTTLTTNKQDLFEVITEAGDYTVSVSAKNDKSSSEAATYLFSAVKLETPTKPVVEVNSTTHMAQFVWSGDENTRSYMQQMNGGRWVTNANAYFDISETGSYSIAVKAKGYASKNVLYLDSDPSETSETYEHKRGPFLSLLDMCIIDWSVEEDAEFDAINLWVNGEKVKENIQYQEEGYNLILGNDPAITKTGEYTIQLEATKDGNSYWSNALEEVGTYNINPNEIYSFDNRKANFPVIKDGVSVSNEQYHGDSGYSLRFDAQNSEQINLVAYNAATHANDISYLTIKKISYWVYVEPIDGYEGNFPANALPAVKWEKKWTTAEGVLTYKSCVFNASNDIPFGEWVKVEIDNVQMAYGYGNNDYNILILSYTKTIDPSYVIYIDDICFEEVYDEVKVDDADYAVSYSPSANHMGSWQAFDYTELDFGVENANKTLTVSMEVCGNADATLGNDKAGIYSAFAPDRDPVDGEYEFIYMDATKISSLDTWSNLVLQIRTNDQGKCYITGAYNRKAHEVDAFSIFFKNIQVIELDEVDGTAMPDGTQKTEVANGYHQAFAGLSTELAAGTLVNVEMDVYITGTYDMYSYIGWVDTVWTTDGGEVNNAPSIVNYDTFNANAGQWIHVEFEAMVRDFDVLRLNSAYPTMDVASYGNAVFLLAESFKSAASFNYKNVVITEIIPEVPEVGGTAMPNGTQKNNPDKYYQSAVGFSVDMPVGSLVKVEMDVYVVGTFDDYSYISWVDSVWGDNAVNQEYKLVDFAAMSANAGQWVHLSFYANVRDFDDVHRDGSYPSIDVSATGTGVFVMAANFLSAETFHYDKVVIKAEDPGVAVPDGTEKTANPNGYYQAAVGLSTDLAAGTLVNVEMDVYITGAYDQYTTGIRWVDTVWTTDGGEVNGATTIVDYAKISANVGKWIHVEFTATVRDFDVLRLNSAYATIDVASAGNAVFLVCDAFKSAESFNYKNVVIRAEDPGVAVPDGTEKTANANGYHQAFVGLSTDLEAGTAVKVKMEIYVTGTADSNSTIKWVDTVYSVAGGEVNNAPTIVDYDTMSANAGQWISVEFDAIVKDYDVLRMNSAYATVDVSLYGNAVFLMAKNFKSDASFNYRNVVITEA